LAQKTTSLLAMLKGGTICLETPRGPERQPATIVMVRSYKHRRRPVSNLCQTICAPALQVQTVHCKSMGRYTA
jgi:hypothetical protein